MIARRIAVASVPHLLAAGILLCQNGNAWPAPPPTPGAIVIVARAVSGCFSDTIRVTGFLVPREEALVMLDADGYRIAEILVAEGERVTSGQPLARLARQSSDVPSTAAASAAGRASSPPAAPATITLRAPVGGIVTRSTAMVGAMASLQAEPLFRIMVNGEIELEVEVPSIHVPKLKRDANRPPVSRSRMALLSAGECGECRQRSNARPSLGELGLRSIRSPRSGLACSPERRSTPAEAAASPFRAPRSSIRPTEPPSRSCAGPRSRRDRFAIGLTSDTSVEIREGLQEGDIVVANAGTSLR